METLWYETATNEHAMIWRASYLFVIGASGSNCMHGEWVPLQLRGGLGCHVLHVAGQVQTQEAPFLQQGAHGVWVGQGVCVGGGVDECTSGCEFEFCCVCASCTYIHLCICQAWGSLVPPCQCWHDWQSRPTSESRINNLCHHHHQLSYGGVQITGGGLPNLLLDSQPKGKWRCTRSLHNSYIAYVSVQCKSEGGGGGGGEVPSFLVQESGIGSYVAFMCVQEPCEDSQYLFFLLFCTFMPACLMRWVVRLCVQDYVLYQPMC